MLLYRLSRCRYAADISGEGSKLYGGRWNSVGIPALYFANSRALAVLEVLVHLPPALLPDDFCMSIFESDAAVEEIKELDLPNAWYTFPFLKQVQLIGDQFFKEERNLFLKVPSAAVNGDFNFLMNPRHPEASHIKFLNKSQFTFDKRLF